MTQIDTSRLEHKALNEQLKEADGDCALLHCLGQRFIAAGLSGKNVTIDGIPGNALGAYLNGSTITVNGNAQDAVGDTMNDGEIVIHGNVGDAAGYAMRGGAIFVRGNAGYRAGIHMKEYGSKRPSLVIGGCAGSFLGEYQAGGRILVLGLHKNDKPIVGKFPCTGMHGGKMLLRGKAEGVKFPNRTIVQTAAKEDIAEFEPLIRRFCQLFGYDAEALLAEEYTLVTPDSHNPYKQMYVSN